MSYLKQYSKKTNDGTRNQPVSSRITEDEFKAFNSLCIENGFSVSQAIRLLIQKEIESSDAKMNTERIQINTESKSSNTERKRTSTNVNKKIRVNTGNRFTTNPWKIDDFLPCPICDNHTWVSAGNYARHAKSHDMTTQEIFTQHVDKANEMVKERMKPSN